MGDPAASAASTESHYSDRQMARLDFRDKE